MLAQWAMTAYAVAGMAVCVVATDVAVGMVVPTNPANRLGRKNRLGLQQRLGACSQKAQTA